LLSSGLSYNSGGAADARNIARFGESMDAQLGQPLRLKVGSVTAFCPTCRRENFVGKMFSGMYSDFLVCLACKTETARWTLIDQIANEVGRRAKDRG
jgi:hypothetical protein